MKFSHFLMFFVFVTYDASLLRDAPVDRQGRIAQQETALCLRVVQVVAFVRKDRALAQHGEAMGKTAGNEELPFVLFAQLHTEPLSERGTLRTQVYRYV